MPDNELSPEIKPETNAEPTAEQNTTPAPENQPETAAEKPARSAVAEILSDMAEMLEVAFLTMLTVMLLLTYVFQRVDVEGPSMRPTLYSGDEVLVCSFPFLQQNGRILVIDSTAGALFTDKEQTQLVETKGLNEVIIKRLIAHEGQEINIDFVNGTVAVDGVQLTEPYIADITTRNDGAFSYPFTVPEGYFFVMGDNRPSSSDSRSTGVGLVPIDHVIGTAIMRYDRDEESAPYPRSKYDLTLLKRYN